MNKSAYLLFPLLSVLLGNICAVNLAYPNSLSEVLFPDIEAAIIAAKKFVQESDVGDPNLNNYDISSGVRDGFLVIYFYPKNEYQVGGDVHVIFRKVAGGYKLEKIELYE